MNGGVNQDVPHSRVSMRMLKLLSDALMNMNEHVTKDRGSYKVLKEGNR